MLSYESANRIPTRDALIIIDAIDNRDKIIECALKNIEKKYNKLINENNKLKNQLAKCENKINDNFSMCKNINANLASPAIIVNDNCDYKDVYGPDGITIISEFSRKGNELCAHFTSRDFICESQNGEIINDKKFTSIYNDIKNIIKLKGKQIILNEETNTNVNINDINIVDMDNDLNNDIINNIMGDYDIDKRSKFLASLINILTDYISENVHVEKVLKSLDLIIKCINKDTEFLNDIFKTDIDVTIYNIELGIIFKGGNVYRLYSHIIEQNIETSVFQNYMTDIKSFFGKSDCDFSIIIIKVNKNTNEKGIVHLGRNNINTWKMTTLMFMILNKFRNIFLNKQNYEYLNLCGSNDSVISSKMIKIASKIKKTLIDNRLKYEIELFKYMIQQINFTKTDAEKNELNQLTDINIVSKMYDTDDTLMPKQFVTILSKYYTNYTNRELLYGIPIGNNIVDWYKLFISISFDDLNFLPRSNKFNIKTQNLPQNLIINIKALQTDTNKRREIKSTYNVINIARIVIGDHSYRTNFNEDMTNQNIYDNIMANDEYPDNVAKISKYRISVIKRLSSNRNDFVIKFHNEYKKNKSIQILEVHKIPFDNGKSLVTPFFISINKELLFKTRVNNKIAPNFLVQMERFSEYGSSGFIKSNDHKYEKEYTNIKSYLDERENKNEIIRGDFCLTRLMLNVSIVFETIDNNYFILPIPAEFIDLSYAFTNDFKNIFFEFYENLLPLKGNITIENIFNLTKKFKQLISFANNNKEYEVVKRLENLDFNVINEVIFTHNIRTQYNEFKNNLPANLREITDENLFKILKFYTYFGSKISPHYLELNTIYFFKLNVFILDLYTIFFIENNYPWDDNKYIKRLQRYIFFIFIERLQKTTFKNLNTLLRDFGVTTNKNDNDSSLNNNNINLKILINKIKTNNYQPNIMIERANEYIILRKTIIPDKNSMYYDDDICISICAIDHFMYGYHLLDFFPIYKNNDKFIRTHFIYKIIDNDQNNYILITIKRSENNIKTMKEIIEACPKNKNDFENGDFENPIINPKIITDYNKRYILLTNEFYEYIKTIDFIREKLIMIAYNYIYDKIMTMTNKMPIIPDITNAILNMYEGDIVKILSIVN